MFDVKPIGAAMFPISPDVTMVDESFIAQYQQLHAVVAVVMNQGRSVNFGVGADGRFHLRRRIKQVRRDFAVGFHLPAPRSGDSLGR